MWRGRPRRRKSALFLQSVPAEETCGGISLVLLRRCLADGIPTLPVFATPIRGSEIPFPASSSHLLLFMFPKPEFVANSVLTTVAGASCTPAAQRDLNSPARECRED